MKSTISISAATAVFVTGAFALTSPGHSAAAMKKPATVRPAATGAATSTITRRERLARLVAETAAQTAEETARASLARKALNNNRAQETAAR